MIIQEITEIKAPELDVYARLTEAQIMHPQKGTGQFIAESPLVIERALDAGYRPKSLLVERKHAQKLSGEFYARLGEIPVYVSDLEVLEQITGYRLTRGVLCAMERKELPALEEILNGAQTIVVLNNVMNPTNVGAIFRSAAALGMDAVCVSSDCSDPLYRRSVRVSMGTVFQIPWTVISAVEDVRPYGFRLVALALREDSIRIDDLPREKLALVLGAEGDGLPQEVVDGCDYTVKIPMYHGVDSLNVAAASAVAFYALRKKNDR